MGALTVQCWFKLSIPSGVTLSENMTILVNSTNGTTSDNHAYHIFYDYAKHTVEFSSKGGGSSSLWQRTLIAEPYQDRWYHVAVVRSSGFLTAYVDGMRLATLDNVAINVGDSRTTKGVSIGGWAGSGNGRYLYGEVQEVSIYHGNLRQKDDIVPYMFEDQPLDPTDFFKMRGYFKLGYSQAPADRLSNLALIKPTSKQTGVIFPASGVIAFEETSQAGEQSAFDAGRNGGAEAIAPLSGAFSWGQSVFTRPTPGIPFKFELSYSSADAPAASDAPLPRGWHHSLETRVLPAQEFSPLADATVVGLRMWKGGVETWDTPVGVPGDYQYSTRRKEYRGEFRITTNGLWTTPERQIYTFRPHDTGTMRGRLTSIRDYNDNEILLQYNANGFLTDVTDSAGGQYVFQYSATNNNQLQSVKFGDWLVQLGYDAANRLISKTLTNTSGLYGNITNTWRFNYYTTGTSSNLLRSVVDPRGVTNVVITYDDYGRRISSADALGQVTRVEYGVPGNRQITTTDAEGFKWIATHDRSGHPIAQQDPLGNVTRSAYDDRGNRISTTDALGNLTLFAYDANANVIAITNALGEVTRQTFDPRFNKPLTQTDALGWVTTNSYDSKGNLLSQSDALGSSATYTYTAEGLVKTQTDANGHTTTNEYNDDGFQVAETDAAGFTKRYLPNDMGWTLFLTNALREVTSYAYDLNGRTTLTLDPMGRSYVAAYDANGNLLTQTDGKGQITSYTYDALNRKIQEVDRAGATNRFTYTPRGKSATRINALNQATTINYDAANRQHRAVNALGNVISTVYDANGNTIATIDTLGQRWTKTYDPLNRLVTEADPFGNTTRTVFDAAGRARETINPNGASTVNSYDGRGRLTNWVDAAGSNWRYAYDRVGNITNITDALGGQYRMGYDVRNARTSEVNQDGKAWSYSYDAMERLETQQEPNGIRRTMEYDEGGRITAVKFNTGRINSFLYDDNDNPVVLSRSGSGPATISQLTYDELDRVKQYTDAFSKTVRYAYDVAGRLTTLTYPDGKTLAQSYDAIDRLAGQVFQFGPQKSFTNTYAYDKAGRLVRRTYPNGLVQTNGFDNAGHLTSLSHSPITPGASPLSILLSYAHDRNGNTTASRIQGAFQWPKPSLSDEMSRFTAAGQITDRVDLLNPVTNSFQYYYDASGNMTNCVGGGQLWTLTYDEDNRSTSMHWDPGVTAKTITNRYDAFGRRIAKTVDGIQTGHVLDLAGDMERVLCDLGPSRTITAWYVHGAGLSFKVAPDGSLTCYHADAQGNIIALTDDQANKLAEYAYTPYGRSLASATTPTAVGNPFLFVGSQGVMSEEEGVPGLYFMRARYYSADAGVFLSTDPVQNIGPTWQPLAYIYVACNPLKYTDAQGEFWDLGISTLVGTVVGAVGGFAVDLAVQGIEIARGNQSGINWKQAGGAAAAGAITGFAAGLSISLPGAGTVAGLAIVGACAGALGAVASSAVEHGNLNHLTAGEVVAGGIMGAIGGRAGTAANSLAKAGIKQVISKATGARKYAWQYAKDHSRKQLRYWTKGMDYRQISSTKPLRVAKNWQDVIHGTSHGLVEASVTTIDYYLNKGFEGIRGFGTTPIAEW